MDFVSGLRRQILYLIYSKLFAGDCVSSINRRTFLVPHGLLFLKSLLTSHCSIRIGCHRCHSICKASNGTVTLYETRRIIRCRAGRRSSCCGRHKQYAWVMARIYYSLNAFWKPEPLCPESRRRIRRLGIKDCDQSRPLTGIDVSTRSSAIRVTFMALLSYSMAPS